VPALDSCNRLNKVGSGWRAVPYIILSFHRTSQGNASAVSSYGSAEDEHARGITVEAATAVLAVER
jgi:hypothetical protein